MSNAIRIAVDAMGGDNSPDKIINGIIHHFKNNEDVFYSIFGDEKKINYCLNNKKFIFKVKKAKSFYYDKYSLKKSYEVLTKIDMKNKDIIINRF